MSDKYEPPTLPDDYPYDATEDEAAQYWANRAAPLTEEKKAALRHLLRPPGGYQ